MKAYRGYEIGTGWCGGVGIFADGYQTSTVDSEAAAIATIDRWHADWRVMVASGDAEYAEAARSAIEACGETV